MASPFPISDTPQCHRSAGAATHHTCVVQRTRACTRSFEGFFKEPVHESAAENFRVRNVRVLYYLEDDSMQVSEPKEENSGIPQGVFIKRHRIPKPDAAGDEVIAVFPRAAPGCLLSDLALQFYTYNDLSVNVEIKIYGRTFRLTDADPFTRVSNYGRLINVSLWSCLFCCCFLCVCLKHELCRTFTSNTSPPRSARGKTALIIRTLPCAKRRNFSPRPRYKAPAMPSCSAYPV